MNPTISHINLFPIKSCAPVTPDQATVESRGLHGDRRWMVVDADGKFVTARKQPRMVLIRAVPVDDALALDAPGMPALRLVPPAKSAQTSVAIWKDELTAQAANAQADAWISTYLGMPARFVFMADDCVRPVDPDYAQAGDQVSFADGFPILLISQVALDELNGRLDAPVPMLRFRPNLVVANTTAHAEDSWRSIRIGTIRFDVVKPCSRCVLTTVDPESGIPDSAGEPLRTLVSYRRTDNGVMFGQNLIPRGTGVIRIGDAVTIIK